MPGKSITSLFDRYAVCIFRLSMAALLIKFGFERLITPMDHLPENIFFQNVLPLNPTVVSILIGGLELALGTLLLFGIFTRLVAFLTTFVLLVTAGFTANNLSAIEFGLAFASIALVAMHPDYVTFDHYLSQKSETVVPASLPEVAVPLPQPLPITPPPQKGAYVPSPRQTPPPADYYQ